MKRSVLCLKFILNMKEGGTESYYRVNISISKYFKIFKVMYAEYEQILKYSEWEENKTKICL